MSVPKLPSLYLALGPGAYSGQLFAMLCDQLLIRDAEAGEVEFWTPSDRAGDYRGLDGFANARSTGRPSVFAGFEGRVGLQFKFYPSESGQLSAGQKADIKSSLRNAWYKNPDLAAWILITPEDFNSFQLEWLLGLPEALQKESEEGAERLDPPRAVPPVHHWGQKKLHSLILKYPECAVHLFPSLGDPRLLPNWRRYCAELADSHTAGPLVSLHSSEGEVLSDVLNSFVTSGEKRLLCVLGSYGAGKTTCLQQFSARLARAYATDGGLIPVFVRLRHVRGENSFRHNLVAYLSREYGLDLDVLALRTLVGEGRLLLIFDGLDEKEEIGDRGAARIRLAEVFDFLAPTARMIVSSRTEFFLDALDERSALLPERREILRLGRQSEKARVAEANDTSAQVVYIAPVEHKAAREYLSIKIGAPFPGVESALWATYDIKDLVKTPLFLNLVAETVYELVSTDAAGERICVVDLYEFYVRSNLEQDVLSGRIGPDLQTRLAAIEDLAEKMLTSCSPRLHFSRLDRELFRGMDTTDRDFLSTAFLIRDAEGHYEFSHRSFLEYFGARRMKRSLVGDGTNCLPALLPMSSRLQLAYFEEMITEEMRAARRRMGKGSPAWSEPVTFRDFREFARAAAYSPLDEPQDVEGFAAVTYYDAVAYAMKAGAFLPEAKELYPLLRLPSPGVGGRSAPVTEPPPSEFRFDSPLRPVIEALPSGLTIVRGLPEWCTDRVLISPGSDNPHRPRELMRAEVALLAAAQNRYLFRVSEGMHTSRTATAFSGG